MRCPACGSLQDRVVDSRQAEDGSTIRRRRECEGCRRRYTTFERIDEVALQVRKRDGRREPFDRTKVAAGVSAAAKGRPVSADAVDALVTAVEERLRAQGAEAEADAVGQVVLRALRDLDRVAAVRFASVYKSFEDVADFEREINLLDDPA